MQLILNYIIMKKICILLGIILALLMTSCHKPQISCEIVKPIPNTTFELGEVIELAVTVNVDNTNIDEVQIYLDDVGYTKKSVFPFNFKIDTKDMEVGKHEIRVVALATSGAKSEKTVVFNLVKYEAPDFVTFSDGKFPKGWTHEGWYLDTPGYDDNYAVRTSSYSYSGALATVNACDSLEFYAKHGDDDYYHTRLGFYVDGNMVGNITLTDSWEKYSFVVPPGEHTFMWRMIGYNDGNIYLDAIRFFKPVIIDL